MPEFEKFRSFSIDDGELDGLSAQQCFVLGYELAQIDALLKLPEELDRPVHAANRERIEESCRLAERPCKIVWLHEDTSESWMSLYVPPLEISK